MTIDLSTATRDDVDRAVRRAITALVDLGDLERLHPVDRIRIGEAAAAFADVVTAVTRRRAGAARRGRRGTRRGRSTPWGTPPGGDAA